MEPDGRQTIYICGYPKSGNTWLARLVGDVLDCPVGSTITWATTQCIGYEGQERPGPYYVRYGHEVPVDGIREHIVNDTDTLNWQMLTTEPVLFMYRDPRDIVLSIAHHWGLTHNDAICYMADGTFPIAFGGGYRPFMRAWLSAQFPILTTSYEFLSDGTEAEIARILSILGIDVPSEHIAACVERQSFAARKAWTERNGDTLPYGKAFQMHFLRRGQVGTWRDELPRNYWPRIEVEWGGLMRLLGYTTGPEWVTA